MSDETTPQPDAERVEATEVNQGIGWYEFITPTATTGIAYVHEGGDVYVPEGGWGATEPFYLAASRGQVHRLIRADVLDVEEMARVLIEHTRIDGIHGDCSCGHVVPLGHSFAAHQAAALRAALLG